MNEKLTRATAALLMFVYCAGIVPAHEIASGLAAGKVRIDYYLNRAEKAYDENEWKRLAEEGVLASLAAWERATLALKEQNADEWNALRSEAKLYYENTVAKRYADMIRARYTRSHEAKISSELTRRLKEKINNFDSSGYTLAETAKLYDDWNEESRKIIDEYLDGYGTENFSEAVRREAEMLSMIEGRRFISRFMKDKHSLKAEKAKEAAAAIAEDLTKKTYGETERDMNELFAAFEKRITAPDAQSADKDAFLSRFKEVFNKGLAKWEDAERAFLKDRLSWENEAQQTYEESEKIWEAAKKTLSDKKAEWEKSIEERIRKFEREIAEKNKEYENEINALLENYRATLEENASNRYAAIRMQESIYKNMRDMLASSHDGIKNWGALWGTKYNGVYSYWKTEDASNVLYNIINGKNNIKIDVETAKRLRKDVYDWQDSYIRLLAREYDTVTAQYVTKIENLQQRINSRLGDGISDKIDYTKAKEDNRKIIEEAYAYSRIFKTGYLNNSEVQEFFEYYDKIEALKQYGNNKETFCALMASENVKNLEKELILYKDVDESAVDEQTKAYIDDIKKWLAIQKEKAAGGNGSQQFGAYLEEIKDADKTLSKNNNFIVLAEEIEAGTTLLERYRIALSDKIRLDKTMDNLFSLTQGEAIGYGEAESALLKLKALARAAEEEYEIAKAVDDYASVTDASREAKAETERRLHNAENAYKAAYNEYRILCENLSDDDIQRAREKLQAAYKNLEDAKEAFSEAEKENASLMSMKSAARRDMIERMILLFADTYLEKNTAVLQAARNYYLAKFSELEERDLLKIEGENADEMRRNYKAAKSTVADAIRKNAAAPARAEKESYGKVIDYIKELSVLSSGLTDGARQALVEYTELYSDAEAYRYADLSGTDGKAEAAKLAEYCEKLAQYEDVFDVDTLDEAKKAELHTLIFESKFLESVVRYAKKTRGTWNEKLLKNGYLHSTVFSSAEEKEAIRKVLVESDAADLQMKADTADAAAAFFLQADYTAGEKTSAELYGTLTRAFEQKDDSTKKLELYAELFSLSYAGNMTARITESFEKTAAAQRAVVAANESYEKALSEVKYAEAEYAKKVDECNVSYAALEKFRTAKRCAQAVYDWASSIYLENIGVNTHESYITPKERLSKAAYAKERTAFSIRVLENIIAEKRGTDDLPAENDEIEAYKKADRAYYERLVLQYELHKDSREKEKKLFDAEAAELEARSAVSVASDYTNEEKLVHISKDESGWNYALSHRIVAEEKSETHFEKRRQLKNYVSGDEEPKESDYEEVEIPVIRRWTEYNIHPTSYAGADNDAEQKKYFTDGDEAAVETVSRGRVKRTAAESEAVQWLSSLWSRGHRYAESVILAAMYLQYRCGNKIKILQSASEHRFAIPNVGSEHGIDVYGMYKQYREDVLWDAYDSVIKVGGESDIAKCILFRNNGNILGTGIEEYEANILKERSLERLGDAMYRIERNNTYLKWLLWGIFSFRNAIGKYAYSVVGKCYSYRNSAAAANIKKRENITQALNMLKEAENTRKAASADYAALYKGTPQNGKQTAKIMRDMFGESGTVSRTTLDEIVDAADESESYSNALDFIDKTVNAYKAKKDEAALVLAEKRTELSDAQKKASAAYYAYGEKNKTIDEETRTQLRKLALESSDIRLSAEARKRAAEKYAVSAAEKFSVTEEEKRLLAEYAEKAWGRGTYDSIGFIKSLGNYYNDYRENNRNDFSRTTETYDEYIGNELLRFAEVKIGTENAWRYEAYKIELTKNADAAKTEYKNALEQLNDIAVLASDEWTKAQERMNVQYNTWRHEFVQTYKAAQSEWESNYDTFLSQKQEWINGMYSDAAAETDLRQDEGEQKRAEKLAETRKAVRKTLPKTIVDGKKYIEALLGETLIGKLEAHSGVLENRIESVAFAAARHGPLSSDIEIAYRAAEVLAATNRDLQQTAVRIAAQQAEQNLIKSRDRYAAMVHEQNQKLEDYVFDTVIDSGYTVSGKIIKRRAVIDSNFWGVTEVVQTVHPYEWYVSAVPDIGIDTKALLNADTAVADYLMAAAHENLSAWYKRVFGEGGEFEKHRGKAPVFKSGGDFNIKKGRDANIETQGTGEIGLVMLDILWNDIEENYGWNELAKPDWDQKLWSGNSFLGMDPPSVRTVTTVAAAAAATIVSAVCTWGTAAPVVAALCSAAVASAITMSNELLFAALDFSGGYKTADEIGKSLAMSAVTSVIGAAGGAGAAGAGILGGFAGAALKTGISVSGELTGKFVTGGIATNWNWSEMGKQWDDWNDWKGTAIGMVGSAVTNGFETAMLGDTMTTNGRISGYTKAAGFNSAQIGQIKTFAGTVGNLTASAMELGISGETTVNILNTSDLFRNTKFAGASSGLLALTFGKDGVHTEISTAGRNYSITKIANTIGGMKAAGIALRTNAYERKNGAGTGTALRSQYGFGDGRARQQADDILYGRAELIKDDGTVTAGGRAKTVCDGRRKIYVNGNTFDGTVESALAMGIALQHEAYRDGVTGSSAAQQAETMQTVYKHTEMALRMTSDGMAGKMMNGVLSYMPELKSDIGNYNRYMFAMAQAGEDEAKQREAYEQYAAYVNGAYDSSGDYWKLTHGGQLVNDRQGWLKDENGKYIGIDGKPMDEPIEGKTLGARGIETGLLNLLAGTSGRSYDSFTDAQVAIAQQLMKDAGMKAVNGATETDARKLKWSTAKGGQTLNMYEFMNAAGGKVPDTIFAAYYNTTVDSELAKVWNVDLGFEKKRAVPESLAEKYSALRLAHIQGVKHPTGLKNKYKFTVYGSDDIGTEFFKLNENNPFLDDILKQTDSSFNDLQYMQPSGCNFMASMAYPQLLTGKIFSANQIKSLWKEAGKDSSILNITNDINLGQGNVRDPDKLTDFAWKELGKTNSRYNNFALSFGDYTRYNVATYSLPDKLKLKYSYTGHFVLGEILYNSGTTTDFILRRDLVKLYAR